MLESTWSLVAVLLYLAVSVVAAQEHLWKYALGYKNASYADYAAVLAIPDYDTAKDITAFYTGLGGLPSLGPSSTQDNCEFAWNLGGVDTVTCNCGDLPAANEVVSLETNDWCTTGLISDMLTTATLNNEGAVSFFKSTLPAGCDSQCQLHGACSTGASGCMCAPQGNDTSFYWTGDNCSEMQPGKGYAAYAATLTFSTLKPKEGFVFSMNAGSDCSVYVSQLPMDSETQGQYVPVSNVYLARQYISFGLESTPPESDELVMQIYLYAKESVTSCWVGNIAGGMDNVTTMQIAIEGEQAQTIGPNYIITLPSQLAHVNASSIKYGAGASRLRINPN